MKYLLRKYYTNRSNTHSISCHSYYFYLLFVISYDTKIFYVRYII